jgi:hypothetical protein
MEKAGASSLKHWVRVRPVFLCNAATALNLYCWRLSSLAKPNIEQALRDVLTGSDRKRAAEQVR